MIPQRYRLHDGIDFVKSIVTSTEQLQKEVDFGRRMDFDRVAVLSNNHVVKSWCSESDDRWRENRLNPDGCSPLQVTLNQPPRPAFHQSESVLQQSGEAIGKSTHKPNESEIYWRRVGLRFSNRLEWKTKLSLPLYLNRKSISLFAGHIQIKLETRFCADYKVKLSCKSPLD
jgi:hypothetical protein